MTVSKRKPAARVPNPHTLDARAPAPPVNAEAGLVLAGAVAKGAFEAGAVRALTESHIPFTHIVGASAGAINGLALAAAMRAGEPQAAAQRMENVWRDEVTLRRVFRASAPGILGGRGLADTDGVLALLRRHIGPARVAPSQRRPVELRIIVAPLRGIADQMAGLPASKYQKVLRFRDADFDDEATVDRMRQAAVASAALPGAFVPRCLGDLGPCADGGVVNHSPIGQALENSDIRRVFVVLPAPLLRTPTSPSRWLSLVSDYSEILRDERFYRDVRRADAVNQSLHQLEALKARGSISEAQRVAVLRALQWESRRQVDIVQIRPQQRLPGNALSGFLSRELRKHYIEEGARSVARALSREVTCHNEALRNAS